MPNLNSTQITETTTPTSNSFFYLLNDPSGTPADRKATLETVRGQLSAMRVTTATAKNQDTTLASDTELFLTILPNSNYIIEALLWVDSNSSADFKTKILLDGATGATGKRFTSSWSGTAFVSSFDDIETVVSSDQSTNDEIIIGIVGSIRVSTVGGTMRVQWAQNTSTAYDTRLNINSWVRLTKV